VASQPSVTKAALAAATAEPDAGATAQGIAP